MFCKWCGSSLSSSDTKCNRCGKEVPALSNCGGIYDLVPKARKPVAPPPTPPKPPVQNSPTPRQPAPQKGRAPAKKRKGHNGLLLAVAAGVAVILFMLLVMLFVLQGKVNNLTNTVEEMRDDLKNIIETICPDTKPENHNPSDPTVPNNTPSSSKDPDDGSHPGNTDDNEDPVTNTTAPNRPWPDDNIIGTHAPDEQP